MSSIFENLSVNICSSYVFKQAEEDLTKKMGGGKERHFSYYAYAGLTGTRRWTHRSEVRMLLIVSSSHIFAGV